MLGLKEFKIVQYRLVFIVGAQLALATISLMLSFLLRYDILGVGTHVDDFLRALPIFLVVKLVVFYFFDLYRGWWRYAGMSDLVDIIKASAVSVIPIYFIVTFLSGA